MFRTLNKKFFIFYGVLTVVQAVASFACYKNGELGWSVFLAAMSGASLGSAVAIWIVGLQQRKNRIISSAFYHRIYEVIGEASMCWEFPDKGGVFQNDRALKLADELVELANKELNS